MQVAQPTHFGNSAEPSGVHLNEAVQSEREKLLKRKNGTVKGVERRIARYEAILETEREKYARVVDDAKSAEQCPEEQIGQLNAKHHLKTLGRDVKRLLSSQHVALFRFVCRRWREAGRPLNGVSIEEGAMAKALHVGPRSIRQYKADLVSYLVIEHGGRDHSCRYRPALSSVEVQRIRLSS